MGTWSELRDRYRFDLPRWVGLAWRDLVVITAQRFTDRGRELCRTQCVP